MNEVNATPHAELIAELMNPNNPKNEREHAAVREIEHLQEALAQPEQNLNCKSVQARLATAWGYVKAEQEHWLLETTQTLAKTLAREFYPEVTQWECLNDLAGVISQIANMTTGLMRKPEQEPVAWMVYTQEGQSVYVTDNPTDLQESQRALPLYATPPQRTWVGLTYKEKHEIRYTNHMTSAEFIDFIEAKLKEKNT